LAEFSSVADKCCPLSALLPQLIMSADFQKQVIVDMTVSAR